jgi:2'-5' RNA ligase
MDIDGPFRLFIAMAIPEDVKNEIESSQKMLRDILRRACITWTRREQLHLTLRFLGNVEVQSVAALSAAVRSACAGVGALGLRAARLGFFPDQRFPRVIWAGVQDPHGKLPDLQQRIVSATLPFTKEGPEREFTGHVTLGRIKGLNRHEADLLAKTAPGLRERIFGQWTAGHVEIVRSELSPSGARHTLIERIPLPPSPEQVSNS